ncbi:MAG: hypothetical protein IRZ07_28300 [Microbispora sp.]|nr:hypothetical protein [Microbispora sp.]
MTIIVCAPPVYLHRRITHYPTCQRRRRFSGREQLWYGTTWTCLGCGDSWTDGERHPRPFRRGWRAEAVAAARRDWEQAGRFDRAAHRAWVEEQLGQLDTPAVEPAATSGGES